MPDYDVLVLGGGSAGSRAARAAAAEGARTAMINDGELGGLCILRGCMPTKAMLASAHAMHDARRLEPFGVVPGGEPTPDFERIMARQKGMVRRFQAAKIAGIEAQPHDVIDGRGRFVSTREIELDGRTLSARAFVLATGSRPHLPDLPGLSEVTVLTSDDVMELERPPASLIVYGAGPIGLELAQFFARIGTRVALVNRSPLLRKFDLGAGEELADALGREMELRIGTCIQRVERETAGAVAHLDDGTVVRGEAILVALGRCANLQGLGLEAFGLDVSCETLAVDETMQSAHPALFAAGDVTGHYQILHLANREGEVAGRNAAGASPRECIDYRLKMSVTFSDPPYAHVGATEAELAASGIPYRKGTVRFPETGRAITMSVEHGLWTLYAHAESGEILGASILGPRADDLVHLISILMWKRETIDAVDSLPWYHPTLSEVMIDLARAIRTATVATT